MYKISIIIPIFNVERYLERALNSIINQSMDFKDIEVIMVDDCSTDNSKSIMEKYSNKYSNFISIFHEKNSGCAGIPRNTGLNVASGEHIMFLDPDDEYSLDICETLYNTIKNYDADLAFGRYLNIYDNGNVEKSYSPYNDDIFNKYSNMNFEINVNSKKTNIISWVINYCLYGRLITNMSQEILDIKYVDDINQDPLLLKVSPSVWTKIYKKEFLLDNNIDFSNFKFGEDFAFVLQTFLKAKGIVFLNNFLSYYYSIRKDEENQSISNNFDFKLIDDGINNLIFCSGYLEGFSNDVHIFALMPHIRNWFYSWRQSNLSEDENKQLIEKLYILKKSCGNIPRIKLFLFSIIYFIKVSIFIK